MIKYIVFLMISFPIFAQQFKVDTLTTVPGFDINFNLENSNNSSYMGNLNCQGFLKKIDFYNGTGEILNENYITLNECEFLYNNIMQCFSDNKVKCVDINDIFAQSCSCQ